uniref:Uncharacterized protein n=1 Tax=Oryza brachyantha TaxID=4533 RepID=J3LB19_ORYBR
MRLHNALVGVPTEPQPPLARHLQAPLHLRAASPHPDQQVYRGDVAGHAVPLHVGDEPKRLGGVGPGAEEEGQDAVVGEGVVAEAREGGGGEAEEGEREGRVRGEGLDDLGGLGGGEGEAEGAEVVGEVEQRRGGGLGAEDARGGADRVAARVERRRGRGRGDCDGEGGALRGRPRGGDAAGVGRREAAWHFSFKKIAGEEAAPAGACRRGGLNATAPLLRASQTGGPSRSPKWAVGPQQITGSLFNGPNLRLHLFVWASVFFSF